ncbi:SMODS-associated NUDIX domain-containing protein [Streptomyces sp. NPDC005070]
MLEAIWTGLLVALLSWLVSMLWGNRRWLPLLAVSMRPLREVRVSVASLLRIQDDDHYLLIHSPYRPDSYGPLGGVLKYHPSARPDLDRLGFREDGRVDQRMRSDLRGFLPARALLRFARWLHDERDRESSLEAIRRELAEELGEIGHPELATGIERLRFAPVRHVVEGPLRVPGHAFRQIRFFDVFDLHLDAPEAITLRDALLALAADPDNAGAVLVTAEDIKHGRHSRFYVGPHTAYLMGTQRLRADLPPLR